MPWVNCLVKTWLIEKFKGVSLRWILLKRHYWQPWSTSGAWTSGLSVEKIIWTSSGIQIGGHGRGKSQEKDPLSTAAAQGKQLGWRAEAWQTSQNGKGERTFSLSNRSGAWTTAGFSVVRAVKGNEEVGEKHPKWRSLSDPEEAGWLQSPVLNEGRSEWCTQRGRGTGLHTASRQALHVSMRTQILRNLYTYYLWIT